MLVQSLVLYNADIWSLKPEHKRKLRVFEMAVLSRICGLTTTDRKRNDDSHECFGNKQRHSTAASGLEIDICWTPVRRIQPGRYADIPLIWIDNIREDCSCMQMTLIDATRSAKDRNL